MAATTVTSCPACAKKFKVRAELEGRKIRCPGCGEAFVVTKRAVDGGGAAPDAKAAVKATAKTASPAPKPATKPAPTADDDDDVNPYGITNLDLTPRCPHCANELESADALICLYCGYNTQTRSMGSTRKILALTGGEHFAHLLPGLLCAFGIVFLLVFYLFYCFVVPDLVKGAWTSFLDHESLRLWAAGMVLGLIWGLGIFAYKRLILEPKPTEKEKD